MIKEGVKTKHPLSFGELAEKQAREANLNAVDGASVEVKYFGSASELESILRYRTDNARFISILGHGATQYSLSGGDVIFGMNVGNKFLGADTVSGWMSGRTNYDMYFCTPRNIKNAMNFLQTATNSVTGKPYVR